MSEAELERLSRDELDAKARSLGVTDPESLPNKKAVVEAILGAQGGRIPTRSKTARSAALLRRRRKRWAATAPRRRKRSV
jgi:hypothetical protein